MSSQLRPDYDASPFVHPADAIDARALPFQEKLAALEDKQEATEIFVRLFADCIPAGTRYKGGRRWRAGYNRMVALAFVVCPELFNGMIPGQVAHELGLSRSQFFELTKAVKIQLAMRAQSARQRPGRPQK